MAEPTELQPLSETRLDPRPHGGLLTYNPSIELFARAAGPNSLQIWRTNGQVVVKSSQRGEKETVEAMRWKADGQFLAVAWSDGVVRLLGLESSKAVHQMPVCKAGEATVTCIGWSQNHAGRRPASAADAVASNLRNLSLQDETERGDDDGLDLPRELTFLEVETALPKISPLPASGGSGDDMYVFTTRASLEFLFRPFAHEDSDKVDVMLVGTSDGKLHLSIYDSFVIGVFDDLPRLLEAKTPLALTHHASHPHLSTHFLAFQPVSEARTSVFYLVPMDLTFITSSPENLSLLASKTTTLQKLLRYLQQVQLHMVHEWQSTRELPSRFLNSINETLSESGTYGQMDIGQALYHSVVTGHTFPEVKEWLTDQIAERGHKRWDKAVVSGLEGLRSLVHENFLPALERVAIILSRLVGIARFHESQEPIGFTSAQITKVMDIVSCLMLVGHKILLVVMEELDLFNAFSTWMRHEIDHLASTSDELSEKEATMQHGKVLTYIQQYMSATPLRFYVANVPREDAERDWLLADSGSSLLDMLEEQLSRCEPSKSEGVQQPSVVYPQVEFLCSYLSSKASVIFEGIAKAEKRSVRFGQPTKIELEQNILQLDLKTCAVRGSDPEVLKGETHAALTMEQHESIVYLFRTETNVFNGISGNVLTQVSSLELGGAKIVDVKFLNDDALLVLLCLEEQIRVFKIPYRSAGLPYRDYAPGVTVQPQFIRVEQIMGGHLSLFVCSAANFRPLQMEVREASELRGRLPARICLLGEDLQSYRVFALPESFLGEAS